MNPFMFSNFSRQNLFFLDKSRKGCKKMSTLEISAVKSIFTRATQEKRQEMLAALINANAVESLSRLLGTRLREHILQHYDPESYDKDAVAAIERVSVTFLNGNLTTVTLVRGGTYNDVLLWSLTPDLLIRRNNDGDFSEWFEYAFLRRHEQLFLDILFPPG